MRSAVSPVASARAPSAAATSRAWSHSPMSIDVSSEAARIALAISAMPRRSANSMPSRSTAAALAGPSIGVTTTARLL